MKRYSLLALSVLASLSLMAACTNKTTDSTTSSSSQTTEETTTSSSSSQQVVVKQASIDIEEIQQGDFTSLIGTWANSQGGSLTFDTSGLVTSGFSLAGTFSNQQGILLADVLLESGAEGFVLYFVPKGTVLPQDLFEEGSDTSDSNQDRIVFANGPLYGSGLDSYYRQSTSASSDTDPLKNTDTGVMLESGPVTIEYANSILGDKGWTVIEGNYTRTEAIPYNLIQGTDGSHYTVYQNGVILDATYTIIYQP